MKLRRTRRGRLSARLYRRVLLLLALTGLVMGGVLYAAAEREMDRAADRQLANAARMLFMLMQDELDSGVLVTHDHNFGRMGRGDRLLTQEDQRAFRASFDWCMFVVFWNGRPIAQSNWGVPVYLVQPRAGLRNFTALGDRWRSYGLAGNDRNLLIVVAERRALRHLAVGPVVRELALPLLLLLAAGMAILWWTLRQGLAEVGRLASGLSGRSLADLTPLDEEGWPAELGPLVEALNKLFARLGQAYELEQAFTDDVAHELRTPLAAVRAQAQLLRKASSGTMREDADRLVAMTDRANGLIGGMLTLARLDATTLSCRSIDVHALVADVAAEQFVNLPADALELTVVPDHAVRWHTDEALLRIALSAVLDNAIRHARGGKRIDIALVRMRGRLDIVVGDHGPGVPDEDRERLLRRFERGGSDVPGSGLGLSIAARAMALIGGSIDLEGRPDGPGLLVALRLRAGCC